MWSTEQQTQIHGHQYTGKPMRTGRHSGVRINAHTLAWPHTYTRTTGLGIRIRICIRIRIRIRFSEWEAVCGCVRWVVGGVRWKDNSRRQTKNILPVFVVFVAAAVVVGRLFIAQPSGCCCCCCCYPADAVYLCRIYRFILTSLYVLRLP